MFSAMAHSACDTTVDITPVHDIQGSSSASSMTGEAVTVEGLVTKKATQLGTTNQGLYLQVPQGDEDGDEATSEGIFIRMDVDDMTDINTNDLLRVTGEVLEYYNETRIEPVTTSEVCQKAADHSLSVKDRVLPATTVLQQWADGDTSMERYEGMKVTFTGIITRSFSYDYSAYRSNMALARDIQFKPTQLYRPGTEADILNQANTDNRIILEEGDFKTNGEIGYYPQFEPFNYPLRIGSTVTDIPVVIGYGYSKYFMVAVGQWDDATVTPPTNAPYARVNTPPAREAGQRVVGLNLLNYFTDVAVESAPLSSGNRGADNTEDFYLQRLKITRAIGQMDPDLLGLLEIGNNGQEARSAIVDIVGALNYSESDSEKHYQFIYPDGVNEIGTDAIAVGLIYRPSVFVSNGDPVVLDMPKEISTDTDGNEVIVGQRDSLAQEFCRADATDVCMTVIVNHFKSKSCSGCVDDTSDDTPIQGCCTNLRVSASVRLGEYAKTLTEAGKKVLLLGDFNAYGEEDPIHLLAASTIAEEENVKPSSLADITGVSEDFDRTAAITSGYNLINLAKAFHGNNVFSYSYGGELGSLDHVLSSKDLEPMISSISDWHINSLENDMFEYSKDYTGDLPKVYNPFSCSDHDPIIIDLDLE